MVSWESRRDTLRRNMLGRIMPAAASRRGNAREASCRTLSLIVGAPQSVSRTLLQRGMTAVGWHGLADEARSVDPTSLGARSSTPQRMNRLRGTMGQEHSGHGTMFITRAAAHESSRLLDSDGPATRNTGAPPRFLCRPRCETNNPALRWVCPNLPPRQCFRTCSGSAGQHAARLESVLRCVPDRDGLWPGEHCARRLEEDLRRRPASRRSR